MSGKRYCAWLFFSAATAAASPSDEDMARCALIAATESRLACYDALAHRPADKASSAAKAASPAVRAPLAAPAAAVSASPTPAPASAAVIAAMDPENFGLTAVQQHTADLGPQSIGAHIAAVSSDRSGRTMAVLDNGETWSVLDNDGRLSAGDAVTIKRAALGSFLMMTPSNHSYRVHRIK